MSGVVGVETIEQAEVVKRRGVVLLMGLVIIVVLTDLAFVCVACSYRVARCE
jgi:hypothetical protein